MINYIIRRGATLSLIGASVLSLGLFNLKALALPTEEVVKQLNPVPVFTVADEEGKPLVAKGQDQDNEVNITNVFLSQKDASEFVTQVQSKYPDLEKKVRVLPVPLGEIYKLAIENLEKENLKFAYVPNKTAVNDAKTVEGATYEGGVPLFVATSGEDQGYVTVEKDSQQIIPFFFEKSQVEKMVTQFKDQQPDLASSVSIQVVPLELIIEDLHSRDDEDLSKIVLVPSSESIEFIQNSAASQQAAPATQQAPAKK